MAHKSVEFYKYIIIAEYNEGIENCSKSMIKKLWNNFKLIRSYDICKKDIIEAVAEELFDKSGCFTKYERLRGNETNISKKAYM